MGWGGGIYIMEGLMEIAKKHIPENKRKEFYIDVINLLRNNDWDTEYDCLGRDDIYDEIIEEEKNE